MLRPQVYLAVTLGVIGTWQVFDQIYASNAGGPQKTTLTPGATDLPQAFQNSKAGSAAATAVLLFVIILIFTWLQRRVTGTSGGEVDEPTNRTPRSVVAVAGDAAHHLYCPADRRRLFYVLPFRLAVGHQLQEPAGLRPNASSLLFDRALGSPTLDGLRGLASDSITFWRWAFNSVLVTVCVVVGRVMLAALAGYSLARIRFPGYRLVFGLILAVMMVPPIILAIPRFLLLKELGLLNTYPGLIVPLIFDAFGDVLDEAVHGADPGGDRRGGRDRRRRPGGDVPYVVLPNRPARPMITLTILATVGVPGTSSSTP